MGTEDSKKTGQTGPSFRDLLDKVQASEKELKEALKEFECLELDGMWFILDQDYQMKVLSYILRFFDENSWKFDCVQKVETVKNFIACSFGASGASFLYL